MRFLCCGAVWELSGLIRSKRSNSHQLASKQQWRAVEWNADKKVNVGPEKEAATICGAFVRHTPLFHPLAFLVFGVILFKFFDMKGRRPETEHQQPSAGHLSDMHLCFNVLHPK